MKKYFKNNRKLYPFLALLSPVVLYIMVGYIFAFYLNYLSDVGESIISASLFYIVGLFVGYALPVGLFAFIYTKKNKNTSFWESPVWIPGIITNNIYAFFVSLYTVWTLVASVTEGDAGFALFTVPICWIINSVITITLSVIIMLNTKTIAINTFLAYFGVFIALLPLLYFLPGVSEVNNRSSNKLNLNKPMISEDEAIELINSNYVCSSEFYNGRLYIEVLGKKYDSTEEYDFGTFNARSQSPVAAPGKYEIKLNGGLGHFEAVRKAFEPKKLECDKLKYKDHQINNISDQQLFDLVATCKYPYIEVKDIHNGVGDGTFAPSPVLGQEYANYADYNSYIYSLVQNSNIIQVIPSEMFADAKQEFYAKPEKIKSLDNKLQEYHKNCKPQYDIIRSQEEIYN